MGKLHSNIKLVWILIDRMVFFFASEWNMTCVIVCLTINSLWHDSRIRESRRKIECSLRVISAINQVLILNRTSIQYHVTCVLRSINPTFEYLLRVNGVVAEFHVCVIFLCFFAYLPIFFNFSLCLPFGRGMNMRVFAYGLVGCNNNRK